MLHEIKLQLSELLLSFQVTGYSWKVGSHKLKIVSYSCCPLVIFKLKLLTVASHNSWLLSFNDSSELLQFFVLSTKTYINVSFCQKKKHGIQCRYYKGLSKRYCSIFKMDFCPL